MQDISENGDVKLGISVHHLSGLMTQETLDHLIRYSFVQELCDQRTFKIKLNQSSRKCFMVELVYFGLWDFAEGTVGIGTFGTIWAQTTVSELGKFFFADPLACQDSWQN